jgi:alpha-beta hydrolase superfamily lysophospholipase
MTADLKQLADIIRAERAGLPLIAFSHSMGSALTQAHIENHGDLNEDGKDRVHRDIGQWLSQVPDP